MQINGSEKNQRLAVIQLYKKQPVQKIGPCLAQIRRGAPECIFPPSMQRESISI